MEVACRDGWHPTLLSSLEERSTCVVSPGGSFLLEVSLVKPGIIYIFDTGIGMKIGRTSRPITRRMKELSVVLDLRFVHAIACHDVIALERMLHEKYSNKRVRNAPSREIFSLSFADLMHIKTIKNFHGRNCVHLHSLTDVVKHSIAVHRRYFISQHGR